jgi:DNA-binding transcriptional MerR regulator
VSSRTYLSIGDVLTLLREEFPDVTISKIRFLESQGLVNPERSPSGYRKFFEADVERLRWVLRQQREHFLPLKVIRDRLADGDLGDGDLGDGEGDGDGETPSEPSAAPINGKVAARTHAVAGAALSGRGRTGAQAGTTAAARTEEQSTQADEEAMARILADASRRVARAPESSREHMVLPAVPDPGAPTPAGPTDVLGVPRERDVPRAADVEGLRADPDAPHRAGVTATTGSAPRVSASAARGNDEQSSHRAAPGAPVAAVPSRTPSTQGAGSATPNGVASAETAVAAGTAGVTAAGAGTGAGSRGSGADGGAAAVHGARGAAGRAGDLPAGGEAGRQGGAQKRAGGTAGSAGPAGKAAEPGAGSGRAATGTPAGSTTGMVTGASLTTEELCAASGLSEIELAGLQGFGLIEPEMVAGIACFDEDALTVANLAAAFRKYGIEARHLRPYRNAVDREMGLIEQVIIPLLRQRNPESRQRAVDAADELGALGQTMRATLLRTALRRHVGG